MHKPKHILHQPRFHAFCFLVFLFVLVWPILAIPGNQSLPVFFKYLFWAWAAMIVLLHALATSLDRHASDKSTDEY